MNKQQLPGMSVSKALEAMRSGQKVKLPEWVGYWFTDEQGNIKAFTRTGDIVDADPEKYVGNRRDFQITDGRLGFDFAILAIKSGKCVARKGWNGKRMFIYLQEGRKYFLLEGNDEMLIDGVEATHFYGTSEGTVTQMPSICMQTATGSIVTGWVASQTDMLAMDWQIAPLPTSVEE